MLTLFTCKCPNEDIFITLFEAVKSGEVDHVRHLLEREHQLLETTVTYDINLDRENTLKNFISQDNDPEESYEVTLLQTAILFNHLTVVKVLLEHGVNVDQVDTKNQTALHYAVRKKNIEIIQLLLQFGANVNILDVRKLTPVHYAICENNLEIVGILLKRGAIVNTRSTTNSTPLITAIKNGNQEIVKLLLKYKAQLNFLSFGGVTPLQCAIEVKNNDMVHLLLDSGAKVDIALIHAVEAGLMELAGIALNRKADANCWTFSGKPLLLRAIEHNNVDLVKLLLKNGARINECHVKYQTALFHAIMIKSDLKVIELLFDFGANVEIVNEGDITALQRAVLENNVRVVELLLQKSEKLKHDFYAERLHNLNNMPPLVIAIKNGNEEMVDLMLKYDKRHINLDNDFEPPLHLAIDTLNINIINSLLSNGADVNQSYKQLTPMHRAVMKNDKKVVQILLNHNAIIDMQCYGNKTPLIIAIEKGFQDISYLLLQNNANVNFKSCDGESPLNTAIKVKNIDMVILLIEKGAKVEVILIPLSQEQIDIAKILITHSSNINTRMFCGKTLLIKTVEYNNDELFNFLVQNNANINRMCTQYKTPLHYAIALGNSKFATVLLKLGAKTETICLNNTTPLITAINKNDRDMVNLLLQHGADANFCSDNNPPLHEAILNKNLEIIKPLIEAGADVNIKDKENFTPLHRLLFSEFESDFGILVFARMLLNKGADINIIYERGTLLHYAVESSKPDFVSLLLEYNVDINVKRPIDNYSAFELSTNLKCSICKDLLLMYIATLKIRNIDLSFNTTIFFENEFGNKWMEEVQKLKAEVLYEDESLCITLYDVLTKSRDSVKNYIGDKEETVLKILKERKTNYVKYKNLLNYLLT